MFSLTDTIVKMSQSMNDIFVKMHGIVFGTNSSWNFMIIFFYPRDFMILKMPTPGGALAKVLFCTFIQLIYFGVSFSNQHCTVFIGRTLPCKFTLSGEQVR